MTNDSFQIVVEKKVPESPAFVVWSGRSVSAQKFQAGFQLLTRLHLSSVTRFTSEKISQVQKKI